MKKDIVYINKFIKKIKIEGIKRKLDELGRLVIPNNYRKEKVIDGESKFKIYQINNFVIVKIVSNNCKGARKFDGLGRVVVDIEIRRNLNWNDKDIIEIWTIDDYFILKKFENKCIFCGKQKNLIEYKNKLICEKCKKELSNKTQNQKIIYN